MSAGGGGGRSGSYPCSAIAHQQLLLAQAQGWFALVPADEQPVHRTLICDTMQLLPLLHPVGGGWVLFYYKLMTPRVGRGQ